MQNNKKFGLLLIVGIAFFTLGLSKQASATSTTGTCYFSGSSCTINRVNYGGPGKVCILGYGNDLFNGRDCYGGGDNYMVSAVDASAESDKKATLINIIDYIHNSNTGLNDNEKISARYIMSKMTDGHPDDWGFMMQNTDIEIQDGVTVEGDYTTFFYQKDGVGDILEPDYEAAVGTPTINIVSRSTGDIYAKIEKGCGNLIANKIKIPPSWSISSNTSVDQDTADVGDVVTWTHSIRNEGPDATDIDVKYGYEDYNLGTLTAGQGKDSYSSSPSYYTVLPDDVGKKICRKTIFIPTSSSNSNGDESGPEACVTINTPDIQVVNSCRPINIPVNNFVKDAHGNVVPLYLTASNGSIDKKYGPYYSDTVVDLTADCTTGDRWSVKIWSNPYDYKLASHLVMTTSCSSTGCYPVYREVVGPDYQKKRVNRSYDIGPCYDYILKPSIDSMGTALEAGSVVTIRPKLESVSYTNKENSEFYNKYNPPGLHTKSKSSEWQVNKLIVNPGDSVPSTGIGSDITSDKDPCVYYEWVSSSISCSLMKSGRNTIFYANNTASSGALSSSDEVLSENYPAGTKVCYVFSIKSSSSDEDKWAHSSLSLANNCIVIAKKPKVQVWGGDLYVGKAFGVLSASDDAIVRTSTSTKNNKTFGSWIEYGIFARNTITGAASGSAFAGGMADASNKCNYSTLSFANVTSGGTSCAPNKDIGKYNSLTSIPDVEASFSGGLSNVNVSNGHIIDINNFNNGIYNYTVTDGTYLGIQGGVLPLGKSIVLKVNGKVKFLFNQTDSGEIVNDINKIPQLVVIADNIDISHDVTKLDAWLIARGKSRGGYINTCSAVTNKPANGTEMTINQCNDPLVINGPIMANKIYLNRTAGSTVTDPGAPAEIFNLRADAYLWAYNRASGSGHMQTVYSTELPVRM